jgi:two-component system NtrC family sensor kinase
MDAKEDAGNAYYRLLTRRIIAIIVVVSIIPLVLISGTIRYYFQVSYQAKVLDHLKVLIKKHRQNIDGFLTERLSDIQVLAHQYTFKRLADDAFLKEQLSILQGQYGRYFVDIGVVDDRGIQIAYAGPFQLKMADYSKAQWFQEAIKHDDYVSDVFPGLRGLPHFIVAVRREYDGANWILRATVDFDAFNSLVENIRIGSTGFAFILNKKAEFQTKPRSEVMVSREPYLSFLSSPVKGSEDVSVVEAANDSGIDQIYVMSRLKGGDWVLAFQQTADDAYSAMYAARRTTILIFVLGVVGIIVVAILLSKQVVKRIQQADREKEMMNEQVIEAGKLASLGELAAGIAHEINNPVAIMVEEAGWIQDLLDEEDRDLSPNREEFRRALSQIRTQGSRCKQITHKLLSFARKTDPKPKKVKLNDVIEDAIGLCQQRIRYGNVRIETNLAENLPTVEVSPSEMQQVLMNLINNGLDAVDSTGGKVEITSRVENNCVIVDVADDGPGIPSSILPRIFDPFFSTKPVGKGTGLGLSICYGIIKKMGGEISVNTAEVIGTTFHLKLPLTSESSSRI